ncbi:MAG TPA: hypothetical protein VM432_10210 [Bdellovibrionales bacterium]|nr:hypothetical protein [Bdellovibrionales bacterium]
MGFSSRLFILSLTLLAFVGCGKFSSKDNAKDSDTQSPVGEFKIEDFDEIDTDHDDMTEMTESDAGSETETEAGTQTENQPTTTSSTTPATQQPGGDSVDEPVPPAPAPVTNSEPTALEPTKKKPLKSSVKFVARWDKHKSGEAYTRATLTALAGPGKNLIQMVPRDMKLYCPSYAKLKAAERASVWLMLISAMAQRENHRFDPKGAYTESFKNSKKQLVVSRGLLQISKESANSSAYKCDIKKETDLESAQKNLLCGVKILSYQIGKAKVISAKLKNVPSHRAWRGGAAYWSVLRNGESHRFIRNEVRKLEVCRR